MQFDWLLARQSMISNICLSCITRHPEHNKFKIDMAEFQEAFEGVFEFSVQETSQDLSQNVNYLLRAFSGFHLFYEHYQYHEDI